MSDTSPPPGADPTPPPPPPGTPPAVVPAPAAPPTSSTPPPPPPPGLSAPAGFVAYDRSPTMGATKRVSGLGRYVVILTGLVATASVITTVLSLSISGAASDFLAGDTSEDDFRSAIAPLSAIQALATVLMLATGVLTIIWMFRIAGNIRTYGRNTTWHPLFSIFGWFLPPLFLYVVPFLVLREQWKASDPQHLDGSDSWKRNADNRLLWVWFALYGIVPLVLFIAQIGSLASAGLGAGDAESLAESLDSVSVLTYVSTGAVIGAAVAWIMFVRALTRRHATMINEV